MSGDNHCYEAINGLFVGSYRSLGQVATLGITHVLSAVNFTVTSDLGGRPHLVIPLRDDENDSLLPHLPAALAFIQDALESEGGRVLVHCQAGQSRSVAVAVAYIMKSQGVGAQEALAMLQAIDPAAQPNEGYWGQLLLFQDMRCRLDEEHPVYRLWCLQQVGHRWEEDGWVDGDNFAQPPSDDKARSLQGFDLLSKYCDTRTSFAYHPFQVAAYRCRKCRLLLCSQHNVMPVEAAMGHRMFRSFWKKKLAPCGDPMADLPRSVDVHPEEAGTAGAGSTAPASSSSSSSRGGSKPVASAEAVSSLFLEPMAWMAGAVVGEVQGKLYCPSCNSRLGSFNWSGISNERGAWVTPAFQLHLSRLDVLEPPRVRESLAQIRRPIFGAAATAQPPPQTATNYAGASTAAAAVVVGNGQAAAEAATPAVASSAATPDVVASAAATDATAAAVPAAIPTFTHVVLDCDGVLVDTERASCESLRRSILQVTGFDIPHSFPEDYYPVFGMDVRSCLEHYKEAFARSEWEDVASLALEVMRVKEGIYKELTSAGISAFPGARELILQAQAMGLGVGVASSGAPEKIHHNLTGSGLLPLLQQQYIVSASHVNRGKPAPDVYLEAMRRLQCTEPGRALVVEDAVNGLRAARAAGAFCVAVCTSLPRERLEPFADVVVSGLVEVLELLGAQKA